MTEPSPMTATASHGDARWPDLAALELPPTTDALHLFAQVVGKIRLAKTPWLNHSWQVPLYVSARGLTTGLIPDGARAFSLDFDFLADALVVRVTSGGEHTVALGRQSVASFYAGVMAALAGLGIEVRINDLPAEMPEAVRFADDRAVRAYDPAVALTYWQTLVQVERVFQAFRSRFVGKCSPVHLFWGGFDLVVTRFSGRAAPAHPGGIPHLPDAVVRDAYSHEQSSSGFWPGTAETGPFFYNEAYPTPPGFAEARLKPAGARFDPGLQEFLLPYAKLRASDDADRDLLDFLQSTYEAAAGPGGWDRAGLERAPGSLGYPPV